jgi:prolyl oligopeptidase
VVWGKGWSPDNKGFLYTVQNSGDNTSMNSMLDTRAMYHMAGTNPSTDKVIFSREKYANLAIKPEDLCFVGYTEDQKYILGILGGVDRDYNCFYAPASELFKPTISWRRLFNKTDHVTNFLFNGDDVYMLTYDGAPKYKIVKSNFKNFSVADAETIIPEQQASIDGMSRSKDFMYFTTNDGINLRAYQYNFVKDQSAEITLPVGGTASISPYNITSNEITLGVTSWKQPYTFIIMTRRWCGKTGARLDT